MFGEKSDGRRTWLAKFYQCVGTIRSLAKQHSAWAKQPSGSASDEARDYFAPLCLYASLVLRWCDPRSAKNNEEKASCARRGVFLTVLSGLLLSQGVAGVSVPQQTDDSREGQSVAEQGNDDTA